MAFSTFNSIQSFLMYVRARVSDLATFTYNFPGEIPKSNYRLDPIQIQRYSFLLSFYKKKEYQYMCFIFTDYSSFTITYLVLFRLGSNNRCNFPSRSNHRLGCSCSISK